MSIEQLSRLTRQEIRGNERTANHVGQACVRRAILTTVVPR